MLCPNLIYLPAERGGPGLRINFDGNSRFYAGGGGGCHYLYVHPSLFSDIVFDHFARGI